LTTIHRPDPVCRQSEGTDDARGRREGSRAHWRDAASSVVRQLIADTTLDPLRVVAEALLFTAEADCVVMLASTDDGGPLEVVLSVGTHSDEIAAQLLTDAPSLPSYVSHTREPLNVRDNHGPPTLPRRTSDSVLLLPLPGSGGARGVLAVVRLSGREDFTSRELDLAAGFANYAGALAELSMAHAAQQRRQNSEARERMATDLHGEISGQLFSVGLTLYGVAAGLGTGPMADRLAAATIDLDKIIRLVRATALDLTTEAGEPRGAGLS
jgi:signal transduction histidine kinase